MRLRALGLLIVWLLTAAAPAVADTFDVNASYLFPNPPIILSPSGEVVLSGALDVSNGVVSDPNLQFNVLPGQVFSELLSIVQLPPNGSPAGTTGWEMTVADHQNPNIFLQLEFTRSLPGTLFDFTGADVNGFGVLDALDPAFGFAVGSIEPIGSITRVPEPDVWTLAAVGLACLGFSARRRLTAA